MKKIIFIIILILIVVGVYFLFFSKKPVQVEEPSEELKPEKSEPYVLTDEEIAALSQTLPPLEQGSERAGSFKVGSAPGIYPKFVSGWLDPKRPRLGETQAISIKMRDPDGIGQMQLEIQTEDGKPVESFDLELIEGQASEGVWSASWQVHDVGQTFRAKFTAKNTQGKKDDLVYFIFLAE